MRDDVTSAVAWLGAPSWPAPSPRSRGLGSLFRHLKTTASNASANSSPASTPEASQPSSPLMTPVASSNDLCTSGDRQNASGRNSEVAESSNSLSGSGKRTIFKVDA